MIRNVRLLCGLVAVAVVVTTCNSTFGKGKPPKPGNATPVKVILMAGQSNMVGYGSNTDLATLAPNLQQPQTDVKIWMNGLWGDLQPGLGTTANHFGPELVFGRDLADIRPHDQFALIKAFPSCGSSLALDWDPVTPGASWVCFLANVDDALRGLESSGYAPEIAGMIWMQGERDAKFEEQALAYDENLTNFIQAIRSEFGKPSLPFIIGQIADNIPQNFPFAQDVQIAQYNVWLNVPNTGLVFTDDLTTLPNEPVHYDSAGQLELGARFATELLAISVDVDSVAYATSGGKGGAKNLTVTVTLADEMGPVSGATVSLRLSHESGDFWDATGTTDGNGKVSFTLNNAPNGWYATDVTAVNAGVYFWDGTTPTNQFFK